MIKATYNRTVVSSFAVPEPRNASPSFQAPNIFVLTSHPVPSQIT